MEQRRGAPPAAFADAAAGWHKGRGRRCSIGGLGLLG